MNGSSTNGTIGFPARHAATLLLCVATAIVPRTNAAQEPTDATAGTDRVVIQPAGKAGRITVTGVIEDYTGRGLVLQTRRGAGTARYSRDEVQEVATHYMAAHLEGKKLLAAGQAAEADEAFQRALDDEHRTWVRREILASQVKCALWQGDYRRAAQRFLPIVDSDPDTLYFGLMPLVWQEQPPATASPVDAQRWIKSDSAAAQLLGASWLLASDPVTATRTLQVLASSPQPVLQRFAQMQLWRTKLAAGPVTAAELRRWVNLADELTPDLRSGPLFVIGRAYEQQHDWVNAAAAWLWLPLEFPDHRFLAAEAQYRAADALFRAGDVAAARQQSQEFLQRYADTPFAERVKALQVRLESR